MTTKNKEINMLDIEDIEKALSDYLRRTVSISEVECSLIYCIPCGSNIPRGAYLDFSVGDDRCSSYDFFDEDDTGIQSLNGKTLSLEEPWLPKEDIFNFSVDVFKSFDSITDFSD